MERLAPPVGLEDGSRFGIDSTVDGDWAAVGASGQYMEGHTGAGVVFVFHRSDGAWALHSRLVGSEPGPNRRFGNGVAIDGERLAVSAPGSRGTVPGSVYVFELEDEVWAEVARIEVDGSASFGETVALSGDRLLVGDPFVAESVGRVYVVDRLGGRWAMADTLAGDGSTFSFFGRGLGLDGDRAAIVDGGLGSSEILRFYERQGGGWSEVARDTFQLQRSLPHVAAGGGRFALGLSGEQNPATVLIYDWHGATPSAPDTLRMEVENLNYPLLDSVDIAEDLVVVHAGIAGPRPDVTLAFRPSADTWTSQLIPAAPDQRLGEVRLATDGVSVIRSDHLARSDGSVQPYTGVAFISEPDATGKLWITSPLLVPTGTHRTGARLGAIVAVDGPRMATGAPGENAVWVYETDASGRVARTDRLSLGRSTPTALAMDGPWLLVGAAENNEVLAFIQTSTGWESRPRLSGLESFGSAVAVSGRRALVGAPFEGSGQATVFEEVDGRWTSIGALMARADDVRFGSAVALDGARAAVSAQTRRSDGGFGTVAVFEWSGARWNPVGDLTPTSTGLFGATVAIDGGRVIAGAPQYQSPFSTEAVAEYRGLRPLFVDGLENPERRSLFGVSLALDGDRLLVGAPLDDDQGSGTGAAYLFEHDGLAWSAAQPVYAPTPRLGARFGSAVGLWGRRLVIGAPGEDLDAPEAGAAYVYASSFSTPSDRSEDRHFVVRPPFPNPAQSLARLSLDVPKPGTLLVDVYDALGRRVQTVFSGEAVGALHLDVDTSGLAAGLYLVRTVWGGSARTHTLIVAR